MQLFRRSMLQVIVSGAICSTLPSLAFAQTQKLASEYDVIVIGSGFAGLAAQSQQLKKVPKLLFWKKCRLPAVTLPVPGA